MLEQIRTKKKAMARVVELCVEHIGDLPVERLAMTHIAALEDAKSLEGLLRAEIEFPDDILYSELNPGLAVHAGAGMVGVAFVTGK